MSTKNPCEACPYQRKLSESSDELATRNEANEISAMLIATEADVTLSSVRETREPQAHDISLEEIFELVARGALNPDAPELKAYLDALNQVDASGGDERKAELLSNIEEDMVNLREARAVVQENVAESIHLMTELGDLARSNCDGYDTKRFFIKGDACKSRVPLSRKQRSGKEV